MFILDFLKTWQLNENRIFNEKKWKLNNFLEEKMEENNSQPRIVYKNNHKTKLRKNKNVINKQEHRA